jgi:hypothetical protein
MALTPPYWLQQRPNRGDAPTLDLLPPKLDILHHSGADLDKIVTFYPMLPDGSMDETPEDIDGDYAEMGIWQELPAGALDLVDTLTSDNGRLIVGAGTVRMITTQAQLAAYPAETYFSLALTDAIPRQRVKLAGKLLLVDRLWTRERDA